MDQNNSEYRHFLFSNGSFQSLVFLILWQILPIFNSADLYISLRNKIVSSTARNFEKNGLFYIKLLEILNYVFE